MSTHLEKLAKLETVLCEVGLDLPQVTSKKMFGCFALFAKNNVFALVWKHGRIGLKLTDDDDFKNLMDLDGSEPWKAGPMTMSNWILIPEGFEADKSQLTRWVRLAHSNAVTAPKKVSSKKVTSKKASAKKSAPPKKTAKKS